MDEAVKGKVVRLIEATVGHLMNHNTRIEEKRDLELFLDFDMEVLGREWAEYVVYAKGIRAEYASFGDQDYIMRRTTVLRSFLERDRLYFSETVYNSREEVAKENIREIKLLEDRKLGDLREIKATQV